MTQQKNAGNAANIKRKKNKAPDTSAVYSPEIEAYRHRYKANDGIESVPLWLITFTDVIALMLTFFVLLYSMSSLEKDKWEDVSAALSSQFTEDFSKPFESGNNEGIQIDRVRSARALDLRYLRSILEEELKNAGVENAVLMSQKDRLILSLPHEALIDNDSGEISGNGKKILFLLAGNLDKVRNKVEIAGNVMPGSGKENGWDRSLKMAMKVAQAFRDVGYNRGMIIRGLSSGRYASLPGTLNEAEREDLSRRIDIVIMDNSGSNLPLLQIK
ncbi:MAG: hypothetical protein KDI13_04490 [Alphaproteobacteria bacterium]|nr:hypothetical protein [Alphaproteobacteria bacterium]